MSNLVWPALPGLSRQGGIERDGEDGVVINEAVSGIEHRTRFRSAERRRFRLRYNYLRQAVAAPSPFATYSQVGVVEYFWKTHLRWDSFLIDDPLPSDQVSGGTKPQLRVRFERRPRVLEQFPGCWSADVELLEVL